VKLSDRQCLLWAIEHGIICDYEIQTIISNVEFEIEDTDKRLWLVLFQH
jgi:hypothetical protein